VKAKALHVRTPSSTSHLLLAVAVQEIDNADHPGQPGISHGFSKNDAKRLSLFFSFLTMQTWT